MTDNEIIKALECHAHRTERNGWGDLEFHSEAIKAENDLDNLLKELVGENDA